ncbi:Spore maturation protein B [Posidoniimonas corsicana]|uniref:Spore maturation protein B n=1 Tax=Posidoniimonas corsicana TaxID=1938618 RepID=A0A5C5VFI2_9BACT|nr:spore maturation protein [Posidoniimonas corsicana]TWT37414.1 Spore maturation protein B [Posidoniimonas corsicana]
MSYLYETFASLSLVEVAEVVSQWTIPLTMLLIVVWAKIRGVQMYDSFLVGAKEGFGVAVMIMPYLVAILVVIKVFTASGLFDDAKNLIAMGMRGVGIESQEAIDTLELMPLAFSKPLSGGASRGLLVEIFDDEDHGPDSRLGLTASLMMGSTETTFYVIAVYFGAVQVRRTRHTLPACLIADFVGLAAAVVLGFILF